MRSVGPSPTDQFTLQHAPRWCVVPPRNERVRPSLPTLTPLPLQFRTVGTTRRQLGWSARPGRLSGEITGTSRSPGSHGHLGSLESVRARARARIEPVDEAIRKPVPSVGEAVGACQRASCRRPVPPGPACVGICSDWSESCSDWC